MEGSLCTGFTEHYDIHRKGGDILVFMVPRCRHRQKHQIYSREPAETLITMIPTNFSTQLEIQYFLFVQIHFRPFWTEKK